MGKHAAPSGTCRCTIFANSRDAGGDFA